jgi:YHS domain-containing protein
MVRFVLLLILFIIVARVFWRVVDNVIEAASGRPAGRGRAPQHGVPMARDPVCGTFVVRERALTLGDGQSRVYFCSDACRDAYRQGRTA